MRPVVEIPREFYDVPNDLGQSLPLLEEWLDMVSDAAPLAGCSVLLVQHQLSNHAAQTDALIRLGVQPRDIYWLDIPYTSNATVREHIQRELGVPAGNFTTCTDYEVLTSYAPYQHRRSVEAVLAERREREGPLIVLDDGAYIIEALASLRQEKWPRQMAIVEQTTRGIIKLRASLALQRVVAKMPFVNVATSEPKRILEPAFIAMAVCASLLRRLDKVGRKDVRSALVLGYGAIGEQVASYLAGQFRLDRSRVAVVDPDAQRQAIARRRGFAEWQRNGSARTFDLVVGCSGTASFRLGDFAFLEDGALLGSASSGAVELSRGDFIELADATDEDDIWIHRDRFGKSDLHADLPFTLVDRTATFLNAGFPLNFDGRVNTIPACYIQPTPTMMCQAAVQAREALRDGVVGEIDLDPRFNRWIDEAFRKQLGDQAHLLEPPPEEAW